MTAPRFLVVKIQQPLASSEPDPEAYVYDQNRRFQQLVPMSPELRELMGTRPKIYARVRLEGDGMTVEQVLPDQSW